MIVDVRHLRQSNEIPFCRGCRILRKIKEKLNKTGLLMWRKI